mmetsp:Transcript_19870/g.58652  ORF Transcript_19870/g.58652 Transcript_19870/m.58652 type:complete len:401 (+) Transcript_19870:56-1258(+)
MDASGGGAALTAYTAPGVVFKSDDELKAHYRTEWHRHNLKRKVANLKPLTLEAFEARQAAATAAADAGASGKGAARRSARARAPVASSGGSGAVATAGDEDGRRPHPASKAAYYQRAAEMTDEELVAERVAAAPELTPGHDLFSPHVSESLEANLAHMAKAHGFVIPYAEYVSDLPGLIRYLQEKVYVGCTALVEGKQFHSWQAVQHHMVDKGTTRFELEHNEDEFAPFYDLRALARDSPNWHELEVEVEPGEEGAGEAGQGGMAVTETIVIYEPAAATALDAAAAAGAGGAALVVGSGAKELGHRDLRRYYGQSYRAAPPERQAVDRLLLTYQQMGLVKAGGAVASRAAAHARNPHGFASASQARAYQRLRGRSEMGLGMKRNLLIKKSGHKSQNIVFG